MTDPTRVERLAVLRERIERQLPDVSDGSKLAALSREYRTVLAELERLGAGKAASTVDDIARKRSARIAKAKGAASSAVSSGDGRAGGGRSS
jgi:hypothetical protein